MFNRVLFNAYIATLRKAGLNGEADQLESQVEGAIALGDTHLLGGYMDQARVMAEEVLPQNIAAQDNEILATNTKAIFDAIFENQPAPADPDLWFERIAAAYAQGIPAETIVADGRATLGAAEGSSQTGAGSGAGGVSLNSGLTEDQLKQLFPEASTFSISADGRTLDAIDFNGKVLGSFSQGADGLWRPGVPDDAASGGSGGGSAVAAGRLTLDRDEFNRSVFEDDRNFGEDVFRDRRDFDESVLRDRRNFGESVTQNRLSEGRLNRRDAGDLGLGLGDLNLRMQQHVAEILRNPADFLARAFATRGGESPFPEITQADLINKLRDEFGRIRQFTADELAANSEQLVGSIPSAGGGVQGVGGGLGVTPEDMQRAEDVAGLIASGQAKTTDEALSLLSPTKQPFAPVADNRDLFFDPAFPIGAPTQATITPEEFDAQIAATDSFPGSPPVQFGQTDIPNPDQLPPIITPEAPTQPTEPVYDFEVPQGFAEGTGMGVTRQRMFLTGDEKDPDVRNDTEEVILNHDGGRITVLNNEDSQKFLKGIEQFSAGTGSRMRIPRYAAGTFDISQASSDPTIAAQQVGAPAPGVTSAGEAAANQGRLSLFDVVDTRNTTQSSLIDTADASAPPGVSTLFNRGELQNLDSLAGTGFALPTLLDVMGRTPDELEAARTFLASRNRSLDDLLFELRQRFVGNRERPRGRLAVDGR